MARTHRRVARLCALLLATALTATACSDDAKPSADTPSATPDASPSAAPTPKRWPLTGRMTAQLPARRAVVVKIENTDNGEPQLGLGSADMVVEELVEGGLTRLAAFYYSSLPSKVGPVRSVRGTDINIVKPLRALLVASGGAPKTMARVRQAKVVTATEGAKGYFRVSDRPAPYNLFINLKQLPKDKLAGPRPQPYLPWGDPPARKSGKRATHVTATFSGGTSTQWTWSGNAWRPTNSHAAAGQQFRPDNLLALRVRVQDAGYLDPAGNPVPESVLAGKGQATLFHQGRAYQGGWAKKSPTAPLRLVTPQGKPMRVPPGHTWIELVPASGGGLSYGK